MSNPIYEFSRQKRIQQESREEAQERLRKWRESLHYCRCAKPLAERRYLGFWSCRFCGKLIR